MRDLQDWQHDRDQTAKEQRQEEIYNDLNRQHQELQRPESFDLYRNGKFAHEFEDIDSCINYAIDNDEDFDWQIRISCE